MPRYWVIAPVESKDSDLFEKIWKFDFENNLISIGWSQVGDVSKLNKDELLEKISLVYPDKPKGTKGLFANMILTFYKDIAPGDFVLARRGQKILVAVGKVIKSAEYTPGRNPDNTHGNYLEVDWQKPPMNKDFSRLVFPRHTLKELTEEQYFSLLKHSDGTIMDSEETETTEDRNEFVLEEYYLEDFIVSNFTKIFKGKYQIYEEEGIGGQQFDTKEAGKIDILALEPKSNSFVVIELKKGRSSDHVIGQILRYMGWVKENLCNTGQNVKGLIICHDPDPKLRYALSMTKDIHIRYYSVEFELREDPRKCNNE
ncbi:MAG: PDDEXK nuclease domain-containing protein [Thermoguttaceae bacterium]|jgi:restriction system protein